MTRVKWLILLVLVGCIGAWAQAPSSVMVGTNPVGVYFRVDGVTYNTMQTFIWPAGSTHILQFIFTTDANGNDLPYQQTTDGGTRFTFNGWTSTGAQINVGTGGTVVVTASPAVTQIIANLSISYLLHVQFYNTAVTATCNGNAPGDPTGYQYGIVFVNGTCIANTTDTYAPAGALALTEIPYPGFAFSGWQINNQWITLPQATFNMAGPTSITPTFLPAQRVHFMTNPVGLSVLVDRTQSYTPLLPSTNGATCAGEWDQLSFAPPPGFPILCIGDYDFLPGSVHTIGANTPQTDNSGNYWVFEGFSNGQGQNSTYVAPAQAGSAVTITANFVPGVKVDLVLNNPSLSLTVDGRSNWQGYHFIWGQGETHTISAPQTQTDANGRVWNFVGWGNGGPATQTLTMPANTQNILITATYQVLPQVTVSSSPSGLQFTVDGKNCVTPCVVSHTSGTTMQVAAPTPIPSGNTSRFDFTSWSDGSTAASRTVTFSQDTLNLTASYRTSWALTTAVNPSAAGTFTFNPPSPDGFFPDGTQVTVTATAKGGYKFVKWGGDASGSFLTAYLTMSGPHSVTAYYQSVPFIPPAGIMSAAGATPDGTVAPGSVISIYGSNLANDVQIGSTNPLPQTLSNITVTIGNYILPLLFVSPNLINAQLPSELADGPYTLLVHQVGQPDVPGTLTVSRDAPAMFTQANDQNQPLVLALHQDGTLVTFASPAIHGEQITIYGTGFGPYDTTTVDGFFVAANPPVGLVDPVTLTVGALTKTPDWSGAAPGMVGTTIVKLTISDDIPSATTLNVTVSVNSKGSQQVVLPLQ